MSDKIPIGLQLYSVREDCQKDLAGTLAAIAKMGYQTVELAGTYSVPVDRWKTLMADNGLQIVGAHVGLDMIRPDALDATIDTYGQLGCDTLVVPALPGAIRESLDGYKQAADIISAAAAAAAGRAIRMGYHNHAFEFERIDGQVPYDILLANFSNDVFLQYDFGWLYRAGQDGANMVKAHPGRQPIVHIKAYDAEDDLAVVGADDVPWGDVFAACEEVGATEHYIVEHERYADAPLVCVKQCIDNLRAMGK